VKKIPPPNENELYTTGKGKVIPVQAVEALKVARG
jgi:hypothetical protein